MELILARFRQLAFAMLLVALCWHAMMATHELGHVVGAALTGGQVQRVVLHPLTISRTDVAPNPHPATVVWLGPILGCLLPLAVALTAKATPTLCRNSLHFFAGFCLIANGAYIGAGAFTAAGDCGEMLRTGSPFWTLVTFGAFSVVGGLFIWHRLGSVSKFFAEPEKVSPRAVAVLAVLVAIIAIAGACLAPG